MTRRRARTRKPAAAVRVDAEQRRHLLECCAFFRAQHFREAAPGRYRKEDLQAAARELDAAIRPTRRKKPV